MGGLGAEFERAAAGPARAARSAVLPELLINLRACRRAVVLATGPARLWADTAVPLPPRALAAGARPSLLILTRRPRACRAAFLVQMPWGDARGRQCARWQKAAPSSR
ncbi:hypothetical protein ACRAWF_24865 [Streptomyces sp. L7]